MMQIKIKVLNFIMDEFFPKTSAVKERKVRHT